MFAKKSHKSQIGHKNREFVFIAVFGILTVISLQGSLLEIFEQDLANHMVLEHTLFFVYGALSIIVAEIVLRFIIFYEKASRHPDHCKNNYTHKLKYSGVTTNSRLIIGINYWTRFLRKIFGINNCGLVWSCPDKEEIEREAAVYYSHGCTRSRDTYSCPLGTPDYVPSK